MALKKRKNWWCDDSADDLDEYLLRYVLGVLRRGKGREHRVLHACCQGCGSDRFDLFTNNDRTGVLRACTTCKSEQFICDPDGIGDSSQTGEIVCTCCWSEVEAAVGFNVENVLCLDPKVGEMRLPAARYLYVAGRCTRCGICAIYGEWAINDFHGPTEMANLV